MKRYPMIFLILIPLQLVMIAARGEANPYLAKPGEKPVAIRVSTCAVSGGFTHMYAAVDARLFDRYGLRTEHIYIQGSGPGLTALTTNEIQFLYCAGDATIPGLAAGVEVKLVGAPLVGMPYMLLARKDIKRVEDLKGKSIGYSRPGQVDHRLVRAVLKKFNLSESEVALRPIGGSQPERYRAMQQDIVQAIPVPPPLDVRGKKDGFQVIYNLNDLGLPFIYSSLHTNATMLANQRETVQRFVAAMAEAIHFVEKNPDRAKGALSKVLKLTDQDSLQSAYDAYAKALVNRRMVVPANMVAAAVDVARELGTNIKRNPSELFDNSFAEHLDKSGFLRELWGAELH
jgi:ABC-type nitrate/sulfonate/bicarbonate transport system substrate-binding protein